VSEIVVGVDGSKSSIQAAKWAVAEASLRGVALRFVHAFESPAVWLGMGEALGSTVTATISDDDLRSYAMAALTEAIANLELPDGLEVIMDPIEGSPARVLLAASSGASLLVVGSKGHGDLGSILLGSVGMHCVHHATCPVVVVPHGKG
jgi:nucleotide-binding universal stress UspA family protein